MNQPALQSVSAAETLLALRHGCGQRPDDELRSLLQAADRAVLLRGLAPALPLPAAVTASTAAALLAALPADRHAFAATTLADFTLGLLPLARWGTELWHDLLPEVVRRLPVDGTAINAKAETLAEKLGVVTWGELLGRDLDPGRLPRGCGTKSLDAVWDSLANLLEREHSRRDVTRLDLATHLDTTLANLAASPDETLARQARVVRERLGLGCPRPQTLEQIGVRLGLTRERVRQIEAKQWKALARDHVWVEEAHGRIKSALDQAGGALLLADLAAADPWLAGFCCQPLLADAALAGLGFDAATVRTVCSGHLLVALNSGALNDLCAELRRQVRLLAAPTAPAAFVTPLVGQPWTGGLSAAALMRIVQECLTLDPDTGLICPPLGRGIANAAVALLAASPTPLHWSVIAQRLRADGLLPASCQDDHWVQATLSDDDRAQLFAPGTFGTDAHLGLDPTACAIIAYAAATVMANGESARQWSSQELVDHVAPQLLARYHLDSFRFAIALRRTDIGICDLGRGIFTLVSDSDALPVRLRLHELACEILRSTPDRIMEVKELARRIDEQRSCPTTSLLGVLLLRPDVFRVVGDLVSLVRTP